MPCQVERERKDDHMHTWSIYHGLNNWIFGSCKHIFTYTRTDLLPLAVCTLRAHILLVCHSSLLTNISCFSERNAPRILVTSKYMHVIVNDILLYVLYGQHSRPSHWIVWRILSVSKLVLHFILVYIYISLFIAFMFWSELQHTCFFTYICPLSWKSLSLCVTSYLVCEDVSSHLLIKLCML
jgi:hypothetical protein